MKGSDNLVAADIKETDQLQADAAFTTTAEQERWRDLGDCISKACFPVARCLHHMSTVHY